MRKVTFFSLGVLLVLAGCSGASGEVCGPGTIDQGGTCIVDAAVVGDDASAIASPDGGEDAPSDSTSPQPDADAAAVLDSASSGDGWTPIAVDPTPCMVTHDDVLYVFGDPGDPVHPGPLIIGSIVPADGAANGWSQWRQPATVDGWAASTQFDTGQGWTVNFDVQQLDRGLGVGEFDDAHKAPVPILTGNGPGLDVAGGGVDCPTLTGRFEILDYASLKDTDPYGPAVTHITAVFEQHCNGGAPALRGCLHFEQ